MLTPYLEVCKPSLWRLGLHVIPPPTQFEARQQLWGSQGRVAFTNSKSQRQALQVFRGFSTTPKAQTSIAQVRPKDVDGFKTRRRHAFVEDAKFLMFLISFGLTLYVVFEILPRLKDFDLMSEGINRILQNPKFKETLTRDLQQYIKEQGPEIRKLLLSETIENPEVNSVVMKWALDRATECCANSGVTEAMGSLISAAVELPSTQSTVATALSEVLKSHEVQQAALDFVRETLSHPEVSSNVASVTKDTIQSLTEDPQVQTDLWLFMKKSLLPKWVASTSPPPTPPTETSPPSHPSWTSKLKLASKKS